MHEDLLGYLLGALDGSEQQRVERALAASPELRRELERLRRSLEPLQALDQQHDPPARLVDRVCSGIARYEAERQPVPRSVKEGFAAEARRVWSLADGIVIALVALTAFAFFLPALVNSRYQARKLACQNNLRVLGSQLITFSNRHDNHRFPFVPLSGNRSFAGIFAPTLLDSQMISSYCQWLVCPGSDLAEHDEGWRVPSLREVDRARGAWLVRLQNQAGGSYAYCIGHFDENQYRPNRNLGRSHFALMADAPSRHLPGRMSANHGGRGLNICYEDGHVVFVRDPHVAVGDDPLRNRLGYAEAGIDRDDAVVLTSGMQPVAGGLPATVIRPVRP